MKKIIALLISALVVFSLVACSDVSDADAESESSQPTEQLIYEDDSVKATFMRAFDEPSINGVFYLQLLVENKTDCRIWVYLDDASVNGFSTTVMGATAMEIDPGNKSQQPFIISYMNLDTDNIEGVEDITFKICVEDTADYSSILETDSITITLK